MRSTLLFLLFTFSLHAYEVVTYGDAVVDYIVFADQEFLKNLPGGTGGSSYVDLETFQTLTETHYKRCPGSSSVNTIKGLSALGHHCAVIGRIGDDAEGIHYCEKIAEYGVTPLFTPFSSATGRVACLISPEGHRTMRSHIPTVDFNAFEVDKEIFHGIKLFHLEGYQIPNASFLKTLISHAKREGALITMDMGCHELVSKFRDTFLDLMENHLDIVFTNAKEAKILTGMPPEEASEYLATLCPIAVVTCGKNGGFVATKEGRFHYSAFPAKRIDDTGAGDLFMSGFLHGMLHNHSLEQCADLGASVASKIIQVLGTEFPKEESLGLQETCIWYNH